MSVVSSTDIVAAAAAWLLAIAGFCVVINDSRARSECKSSSALRSEVKSDRFLIKVALIDQLRQFVRDET